MSAGRVIPTTLTGEVYFRHRVAHVSGALRGSDMDAVNVDTSVQEKAMIGYPTDASLLYTAMIRLGAAARDAGLKLRQSYGRVGERALIKVGRYGHAKPYKRRNKAIGFLRPRPGRVMRDLERQPAID